MTHLTEELLNEYLDNALAPSARAAADAHLADCANCIAELESLRSLFARDKSLPEAPLERDLSSAVVARLGGNRVSVPRAIRWALVAQGLAVVVVLGLAWPLFPSATSSWVAALKLPILPPELPSIAQLADAWNTWMRAISQINLLPSFPSLPSLHLDPSALLLTLTLVSACLLWLVGNGLLLLLPRAASLKRRHS